MALLSPERLPAAAYLPFPCLTLPAPQFHRNVDYPVARPVLLLRQFLCTATRLVACATSDPPPPPEDGEEPDEEALAAAAQRCA